MNNKRIISFLLAVGVVVSSVSSVTFADVEEDVINAQAKYEEYQKNVDKMTEEIVKFNSEIEQCLRNIEEAESELSTLNLQIQNNELKIKGLEEQIKEREKIKDKRLREYQKNGGNINYATLIFQAENIMDLLDKMYVTTKLIRMDREIADSINEDKKELSNILEQQELNKQTIQELLVTLEEDKILLEEKKKEQEELLTELKEEQKKFGVEVLEVAEMALLKVQEDVINDSGSSISSLKGAISQLKALKENQLTMEGPKNKVDSLINAANERISYLEEQARLEAERIAQEESSKNQTPDYWFEIEGEVATGQDIVNYAYNFLGRPYVWGAVGPDTFDCSGFTSYVYRHCAGIEITRTTYTQINVGVPVSYNNMQPGDLVFTYDNEHVGIYVGGGMYINATYPGSTVRVTPVTNFYAARRVL
ncbi:NlpC/P60 family protein [uncultured Clostridium sp.]|uniref:C40 family peptidase n=1 Tax=uncultured Clostridium sp. TaxID=59620 RepID=UPI0026711340|nr:C40 family peptidase [uncultured Clostridium sp.]